MMCARTLLFVALCFMAACSPGPSPREAIDEAEMLLVTGRSERALQTLQEMRVDHPEDQAILFDIAYAQVATAAQLSQSGATKEANATFEKGVETFLRLTEGPAPEFRVSGLFNAATARIQRDGVMHKDELYDARLENMRGAIGLLEDVQQLNPDFSGVAENLEHARFVLGKLLREPPSEETPPEEEKKDEPEEAANNVDSVTTQIPKASVEVVDGSTIVLHLPPREGDGK